MDRAAILPAMRRGWFLLAVVLAGLLRAAGPAADVEVVRILPGWRDAASFERIGEYLHGKEDTGGIAVLRSRPDERAGYYWLVRLKNRSAPVTEARFELDVITPAAPEPKTFVFPFRLPAGSALFNLGLTGADWPTAKTQPAAWRLRVLGPDGRALAVEKSFLWEMPPKP